MTSCALNNIYTVRTIASLYLLPNALIIGQMKSRLIENVPSFKMPKHQPTRNILNSAQITGQSPECECFRTRHSSTLGVDKALKSEPGIKACHHLQRTYYTRYYNILRVQNNVYSLAMQDYMGIHQDLVDITKGSLATMLHSTFFDRPRLHTTNVIRGLLATSILTYLGSVQSAGNNQDIHNRARLEASALVNAERGHRIQALRISWSHQEEKARYYDFSGYLENNEDQKKKKREKENYLGWLFDVQEFESPKLI